MLFVLDEEWVWCWISVQRTERRPLRGVNCSRGGRNRSGGWRRWWTVCAYRTWKAAVLLGVARAVRELGTAETMGYLASEARGSNCCAGHWSHTDCSQMETFPTPNQGFLIRFTLQCYKALIGTQLFPGLHHVLSENLSCFCHLRKALFFKFCYRCQQQDMSCAQEKRQDVPPCSEQESCILACFAFHTLHVTDVYAMPAEAESSYMMLPIQTAHTRHRTGLGM